MNYQSQINDLQKQINHLRNQADETREIIEGLTNIIKSQPSQREPEIKPKRFKPENGEKYGYVESHGKWVFDVWKNRDYNNHHHATGNCYPHTNESKEQGIWEQVTRRKYETALWDAADWVEGDYYCCFFDNKRNELFVKRVDKTVEIDKPRFATEQSAIDAHTCILGDDAEKYFNRRR